MPVIPFARHEGAHGHEPAGALSAFASDDAREYDADGLYAHGPRRARCPLARLIGDTAFVPGAPTPDVAKAQQRIHLERRRRLLGAIQGQRTRNRSAA